MEAVNWVINLKEDSMIRDVIIEFDEERYILRKHHIKSILEKLAIKGVALVDKKK